MTGFTRAEMKVLALAVAAKRGAFDGWFKAPRRLTRYAAELTEGGYLEWSRFKGGALYRIKAQQIDARAPSATAVRAGAPECAALGCAMPPASAEEPFCLRHWAKLTESAQAAYRVGALRLDQIIIALGQAEQRTGVRF